MDQIWHKSVVKDRLEMRDREKRSCQESKERVRARARACVNKKDSNTTDPLKLMGF